MMKKSICFIIALVLSLSSLLTSCASSDPAEFTIPQHSLTNDTVKNFGCYDYKVYDDGTAVITAYTGSETNVIIPETLDGARVVCIGEAAFAGNVNVTSVRLNSSLERIEAIAFIDCESLSVIDFNDKLWWIGRMAFDATPWLAAQTDDFVVVGDGVLVKYQGSANDLTIPENIRHISAAFNGNDKLVNLEIGDNVCSIGEGAFVYCSALSRITLGKNIRIIGERAFEACENLTMIDIPDKVETIGEAAFIDCYRLKFVRFGESVKSIGVSTFEQCMQLRTVYLPASIEHIGSRAFYLCVSYTLTNYAGTAEQFKNIQMGEENYLMLDAERIYGGEADQ